MFKKYVCFVSFLFISNFVFAMQQDSYRAIFAHGLGGTILQMRFYNQFFGCKMIGEEGPEWASVWSKKDSGVKQSCLGQNDDINVIVKQLETCFKEKKEVVGVAVSKGAATWINTIGWLAELRPKYLAHIKALVLESPFATPATIPVHAFGNFLGIERLINMFGCSQVPEEFVRSQYKNYNPKGITPLKAITTQWCKDAVDRNMVVVFLHSKKDRLISINDSRRLYIELKKLKFKNVYLIEIAAGEHANICFDSRWHVKEDILEKLSVIYAYNKLFKIMPVVGKTFRSRLREFYIEKGESKMVTQDEGLTFDEEFFVQSIELTEAGKDLLQEMQPSIEQVQERMKSAEKKINAPTKKV
ncbi:MAG: hypothetical protein ABH827_04885 [bacterium]